MNLAMLEALENSLSAIVAIELKSEKIVSENKKARELLSIKGKPIDLSELFFSKSKKNHLINAAYSALQREDKYRVWDTEVRGSAKDNVKCDIEFSFVNDAKTHFFLKIRPIVDNKSYYLEKFIETRRRPAFTMNRHGDFIVGLGNDSFYAAFACNKETIKTKYNGEFVRFLQEEGRKQTEAKIRNAIAKNSNGILDIPIQTARGDTLFFYYDTKKLKQVEVEVDNTMFCLLVSKTDTIEALDDPFDL